MLKGIGSPMKRADRQWVESYTSLIVPALHRAENLPRTQSLKDQDERAILCDLLVSGTSPVSLTARRMERLSQLLAGSKVRQANFRSLGGIPLVIHQLAIQLDDPHTQIRGCNILARVIADGGEEISKEVAEREGIQAVLQTLNTHNHNAEVWVAGLETLRLLSLTTANRVEMLQGNILEIVISAIDTFADKEELAQSLACTLGNAVFGSSESREKGGKLGAILGLAKIMECHPSSATVQQNAASALKNLVWECPENHTRVAESFALERMFENLSAHTENEDVASQIIGAVANMVPSSALVRAKILGQKSYISQLFRQVSAFGNNPYMSGLTCSILTQLAEHDYHLDRSGVRIVFLCSRDTNGSSIITSSMEKACKLRNGSAIIQFAKLIRVLCVSEEFKVEIEASDAFSILLGALKDNRTQPVVVPSALEGIEALLSGNDENKKTFNVLGGVAEVVLVMKVNTRNELVTEKCTKVLDNASDGQQATTEDLLHGKDAAVSAVLTAMADFAHSAAVQENACSMLVKIASISPKESSQLVRSGARNSVEMARSRHAGNPAVESLANQLLSLLVDDSVSQGRRGNVRGNASSRLRSRSRTIQASGRARSRAEKSRSPTRMLKEGRRAMLAAQNMEESGSGNANVSIDSSRHPVPAIVNVKRAARKKLSLEPVYE